MVASAQESLAPTGGEGDVQLLRKLVPYARPHAVLFIAALVTMPLAALASLVQPLMVKGAIEATLVARSDDALQMVVLGFAAAITIEFLAKFAQTYVMQLAGQRTTADLRRAVFEHVQRLRVSYFDREPVGRVVTRMTNDIDAITELFASGAVTAISDLLMLVGIIGFMLYLDVELALIALLALPPLTIAVNVFRRWAREAFRSIRVHVAQLNAYLNEQVQGIAVVQAYGREAECAAEYREINEDYRAANYRNIRFDALLYSVVESVATACLAMVLYYAATQAGVLEGSAATAAYVGTVVAFYDYIQRFFVPIRDLATKYTIIQSALASSERIFSLLDHEEPDAPARHVSDAREETDTAIEFRGVTFGYKPGQPVLHDLQLSIARGEQVGIVGATGSGKTTLTALLLRLYDVETGEVRVDGQDIRALPREAHRASFATVPQDVFLFVGTVAENIALDVGAPDPARVQAALERASAWDLVQSRGGLDARVEERGSNWSAGERQLLAFARALYRDSPILVLDEATANVDSETEARIQGAVAQVIAGRTALVIAHRLSTIRALDRILVFHHGRIVEQGSHDQLVALGGIYARLHALQLASEGVAAE
ncbi:MAG: ABC transporter ATP-binding protein [Sandaracinaceae bacterium]|nr:ABC transporter ATP-binding protein [Myxococcales bacterium]MCB9658923.1 ABC transporter ATP-binding protein [Sandaracinaceae bacterium]